jgi:predicted acylesterase/phospholipase RssA
MSDAIVLAGAAVKGAFAAGALSVLSQPETRARIGLDVRRIVGASSGALNGAYYAAAIRAGAEEGVGDRLVRLWLEDATLAGSFDVSLGDLVAGLGLSSEDKILALQRAQIRPWSGGAGRPVDLRVVVTNLDGEPASIDGTPATTYEHLFVAADADFDASASLERLFTAVAASAAVPGAFAPVRMARADGRTFSAQDGGIVNDTPLGHALAPDLPIDRVFVIVPFPRVRDDVADLRGLSMAWHLLDVLVDERLYRDLRHAARVNHALDGLADAVPDAAQRASVLGALGWTGRRVARIVEIRPATSLSGNAFSGFVSRDLRERYVQAGVDAARAALAMLPSVASASP